MEKTSSIRGLIDGSSDFLDPRSHNIVVPGVCPLDDLSVREVRLGGIKAKWVSTTGLRGLGPHGPDGLPDELDHDNVLGWDLSLEFGQVLEESGVDDGDALEEFVVVGAHGGTSDEDVT